MSDPFEHFGEQQQSHELLETHREALAREAAEIVAQHPDARPIGVVMTPDASEAAGFRAALDAQGAGPVQGIVGVMPRRIVLEILRANAPHLLAEHDELVRLDPGGSGEDRRLPLVAITKSGYRFGAVPY